MAGRYDLTIDQGATLRRSFQWQTPPAEPVDITGCHLRARIFREGTPNPELVLTDQTGELTIIDPLLGLFDLEVEDEVTDALLWPKGSWRLDVLHASGAVTALREGAVTVRSKRGDTNGSNGADETVILLTAGVQGPEGPPGTTDASEINTGTLPPAQMPGLTGDVTTLVGTVDTVIGQGKVHFDMLHSSAWSDDTTLAGDSSTQLPTQHSVKSYVDNFAAGFQWKAAVACASIGNLILSGEQLVDGVATSNTRVLVKNQTDGKENGIYISRPGTWVRSSDANTGPELTSATVLVSGGTVNSDTQWTCTNDTIALDVTAVHFAQVSGAGTYTAGAGLALTGNSFSIASGGVTAAMLAPGVGVYTAGAGLSLTGISFSIAAGGVTAAMLAPMTSAQLAGLMSDETGSGALVFATAPALVTPSLGVATANSINKWVFTAPGTSATLTAGADNCNYTFPPASATIARIDAAQIFAGNQSFSKILIQPPAPAGVALRIDPVASQTGNLIEVTSDGTNIRFRLDSAGRIGTRGIWIGATADSATLQYDVLIYGSAVNGQPSWSFPSALMFRGGSGFSFGWAADPNGAGNAYDINLSRNAAGVMQIGTSAINALGSLMLKAVRLGANTFANLPAAPVEGTVAAVTDSTVNTWGTAIAGGGANHVLAYYNGSAWKCLGA